MSLQKQALERDVDALKEKVKWTEGELKESQKKEAQTQTKLTVYTYNYELQADRLLCPWSGHVNLLCMNYAVAAL